MILHLTVEDEHPGEGEGHSEGYYVDQNVQGQLLIEIEQRARNAGDRHAGGSQTYQLMGSSPEPYLLHGLDTEKYRTLIAQILKLEGTATERYFKGNGLLLQVLGELFRDAGFDERNWGKSSVADEVKFYLDVNYSKKHMASPRAITVVLTLILGKMSSLATMHCKSQKTAVFMC